MMDRINKVIKAIGDILAIVPKVLEDIYMAVMGLLKAIKAGDIQGGINALVRLVAILETVWLQIGKAITDLLDAARKDSNTA